MLEPLPLDVCTLSNRQPVHYPTCFSGTYVGTRFEMPNGSNVSPPWTTLPLGMQSVRGAVHSWKPGAASRMPPPSCFPVATTAGIDGLVSGSGSRAGRGSAYILQQELREY